MIGQELDYCQTIEVKRLMYSFVTGLNIETEKEAGQYPPLTQRELELLWLDPWLKYLATKTTS